MQRTKQAPSTSLVDDGPLVAVVRVVVVVVSTALTAVVIAVADVPAVAAIGVSAVCFRLPVPHPLMDERSKTIVVLFH